MAKVELRGRRSIFDPARKGTDLATMLKKLRPDLHALHKKPTLKMRLAINLFDLRRKQGWTQREAAVRAGVGVATYQRIEESQPGANPGLDVIEKMALAFGVDVGVLLKEVKL